VTPAASGEKPGAAFFLQSSDATRQLCYAGEPLYVGQSLAYAIEVDAS